ncbi:hypothetical protein BDW66DRAFT_156466 [Aspergillus desertorum]
MKTTSLVSAFSLLATARATGLWWGSDECYTAPDNTDNECTEQQQSGFTWDSLDVGDFNSYGGLEFSGFTCSNGFGGLRTRTFNNKCITGKIGKGVAKSSAPSISCGQDKAGFSIDKFHLFTSVDADVVISFGMPDGSTCKKSARCSSAGTEVTNDQCGGATSVGFELPDHSEHDDCDLGIGSIGFVCGPGKPTYTPPAETASETQSATPTPDVPTASSTSTPDVPSSSSTPIIGVPTPTGSSPCPPTVTNCPAESTSVTTSTVFVSTTWCPVTPTETPSAPTDTEDVPSPAGTSSSETTTTVSIPAETPTASETSTPAIPTSVSPGSSSVIPPQDMTTTEITYTTVTWCPVTDTITSNESTFTTVTTSTLSTTTIIATTTICNRCTLTGVPSPSETPAVPSETPAVPSETPAVPSETPAVPSETPAVPSETPAVPSETPNVPTDVNPTTTPEAPETTETAVSETPVTEITYTTVTTCPVTTTITTGDSTITSIYTTVSTATITESATISLPTEVLPTTTPEAPVTGSTVTEITYTTITTCPATTTITSGDSTITSTYITISTQTLTSTSTIAVPTSVSPEETPSTPSETETSSTAVPTTSCPNVVPKCINTWLNLIPDCKSNSDITCFCPSSEFTDKVISCIQAWGADADEVQAALSYMAGICAAYVPENPGIITNVPTTITLTAPPIATSTDVSPEQTGAESQSPAPITAPPCTTITYSTYTVTVPQVGFSTATVTETAGSGLVPQPTAAPTSGSSGPGSETGSTTIANPWTTATLATNTPSQATPSPTGPVFTGSMTWSWVMALAVPVLAL